MFQSFGITDDKAKTHQTLMQVNKNWKNIAQFIEFTDTPSTEQELVKLHLKNVIAYLEKQPLDNYNAKQKLNRIQNISILRNYVIAGEFPKNNKTTYRTPIFIDDSNVHCAVGYLLKESGLGKVAKEIASNQLLAYLPEIEHPKLPIWQKTSGLSMFELALIQPTYGPPIPVCAEESPVSWREVTKNTTISKLFQNENIIYGLATIDELGLQQEVLIFDANTNEWNPIGNQITGDILNITFCNKTIYISTLLPNEENPHQLLKLQDRKWEKVAHFNGNIVGLQTFQNKLYVHGNFSSVNDEVKSNFVVIDNDIVSPFSAIGATTTTFDHMKASETALFMTSNGGIYRYKNDSIKYLTTIQYYSYINNINLDANADTLYVSSLSIQGYNSYYDHLEHPTYMNNMLYGQDYPYSSVYFTKSQKVNGNMLVAGDFKTSTLIPLVNDERHLVKCPEEQCAHWYGGGLLYQFENMHYPIIDEGIILDFVQLNDRLYVLKNDGSVSFASINGIERDIIELRERAGL
jgi:hypothetical protein